MKYVNILIFLILSVSLFSQNRFTKLKADLDRWSIDIPALNETIDITVSDATLQDFLQGIAENVSLNLSVDPSLNVLISNSFSNVKVIDVLYFFCEEYNLVIDNTGNILRIKKYNEPVVVPPPVKKIFIEFNSDRELLSIDVKTDSLMKVARAITDQSGKNVIIAPGLSNKLVKGYIKTMPFEGALEKFAFANDMGIEVTEDNYYVFTEKKVDPDKQKNKDKQEDISHKRGEIPVFEGAYYDIRNRDNISVKASDVSIYDLIKVISDSLRINYAFLSTIKETGSLNLEHISYDEFLTYILEGTKFRYRKDGSIYIIAEQGALSVHKTEVVYLNHRTVEEITKSIPSDLKSSLDVIEFAELNCLFLTGTPALVENMKKFILSIDQPVPVIHIEVMIVDLLKDYSISTGLSAGFGDNPEETEQTIFSGIDYEFSTKEINNFFQKINGLGLVNLGNVSSDFYFSIQALEDNDVLKIRSTPKLSTLNGHEATLTSGEVRYYKEEQSNYIGTENASLTSSYEWKSLNADLAITIKPIVSGDENITLEIKVSQEEFQTDNSDEDAPPGSVTRGFESMIRIKNRDMVLLGGIDKLTNSESASGIPILSRIPVLKWIFSSRTKAKTDSKLNVFIRPTVIY